MDHNTVHSVTSMYQWVNIVWEPQNATTYISCGQTPYYLWTKNTHATKPHWVPHCRSLSQSTKTGLYLILGFYRSLQCLKFSKWYFVSTHVARCKILHLENLPVLRPCCPPPPRHCKIWPRSGTQCDRWRHPRRFSPKRHAWRNAWNTAPYILADKPDTSRVISKQYCYYTMWKGYTEYTAMWRKCVHHYIVPALNSISSCHGKLIKNWISNDNGRAMSLGRSQVPWLSGWENRAYPKHMLMSLEASWSGSSILTFISTYTQN